MSGPIIPRERLAALSEETLIELWRAVAEIVKEKRAKAARELRWTLKTGDWIEFEGSRCGHVVGPVVEIRRTKAVVKNAATGQLWTVPLGALKRAPDPDKPTSGHDIPLF